uniref:Fe(2+) transport protein 1 n=1 Tax=Oryza barthii TaxID=65489 RepID=A0A0D3FM65_9ORYZ
MATPRTLVPILPPVAALLLLLVAASSIPLLAAAQPADACGGAPDQAAADGACHDVPRALRLKLIAIPTILVSSVVGVCLPLLSRSGHRHGHGHGHGHGMAVAKPDDVEATQVQLRRNRVVVQVLEMGIVVHSVVIGLGMGASQNVCTIRPLVAAMCFHQMFEGMGLGGCILQAEYGRRMRSVLVFFFSTTTPFGIALGLALTRVYRDNSPTALVVVGLLNAASAGLLHYMALVELLAADFMGPKLQGNVRLQLAAFLAVLLGAGGMSVMAKWA